MLAGGIPIVLEFVSKVLFENTVARVDCTECTSENVLDLSDDEHIDTNGTVLALSFAPSNSTRGAGAHAPPRSLQRAGAVCTLRTDRADELLLLCDPLGVLTTDSELSAALSLLSGSVRRAMLRPGRAPARPAL